MRNSFPETTSSLPQRHENDTAGRGLQLIIYSFPILSPGNPLNLTLANRLLQAHQLTNRSITLSPLTLIPSYATALGLNPSSSDFLDKTFSTSPESLCRQHFYAIPAISALHVPNRENSAFIPSYQPLGLEEYLCESAKPWNISFLRISSLLPPYINKTERNAYTYLKSDTGVCSNQTYMIKSEPLPVLMSCCIIPNGLTLSVEISVQVSLKSKSYTPPQESSDLLTHIKESASTSVDSPFPIAGLDFCGYRESESVKEETSSGGKKDKHSPSTKPSDDVFHELRISGIQWERYRRCGFQYRGPENDPSRFQFNRLGQFQQTTYSVHLLTLQAQLYEFHRYRKPSHRWRWRQAAYKQHPDLFSICYKFKPF